MRTHIAVNDLEPRTCPVAHLMRLEKPGARVGQDAKEHPRRNPRPFFLAGVIQLRESVAIDVLHRQVQNLVLFAEVEDLRHVRVLDPGGDPRFVEEHRLEARVGRKDGENRLERDELLEAVLPTLPRDPHARHSPLGQGAEELIAIELVARRQVGAVVGGGRSH